MPPSVPAPQPPPPPEKFRLLMGSRMNGIVTSTFDIAVPAGFNPMHLMNEIRGAGFFCPPSLDVWIPADMILGVARIVNDQMVTQSKVVPFKIVGGTDGPTTPGAA